MDLFEAIMVTFMVALIMIVGTFLLQEIHVGEGKVEGVGNITDKWQTTEKAGFGSETVYYFEIDEAFYVEVDISDYHNYDVGDTYQYSGVKNP